MKPSKRNMDMQRETMERWFISSALALGFPEIIQITLTFQAESFRSVLYKLQARLLVKV
jgi:hypothetical protein